MKKTTIKIISLSLLSLATSAALANGDVGKANNGRSYEAKDFEARGDDRHHCRGDDHRCWSAPEIDPAQALGALALLSGAVAIVRGRRKK